VLDGFNVLLLCRTSVSPFPYFACWNNSVSNLKWLIWCCTVFECLSYLLQHGSNKTHYMSEHIIESLFFSYIQLCFLINISNYRNFETPKLDAADVYNTESGALIQWWTSSCSDSKPHWWISEALDADVWNSYTKVSKPCCHTETGAWRRHKERLKSTIMVSWISICG